MQSQYVSKGEIFQQIPNIDDTAGEVEFEGLRRMAGRIPELVEMQQMSVGEKILKYLSVIDTHPELITDVASSALSLLVFDFLIANTNNHTQRKIFKEWDSYLAMEDFKVDDVAEIFKNLDGFTTFVEAVAEIYACNLKNKKPIMSFKLICLIRDYLKKFLIRHNARNSSTFNKRIESLLIHVDKFISEYFEALIKVYGSNKEP